MLVKSFYKLISFNSPTSTKSKGFMKKIKFELLKRETLNDTKKFINQSDLYDILSEFVQFSDLYKQFFHIDLPFDNIKFEPNLVKMQDGGIRGRKIIYMVDDEQLKLEIGAVVELGDKNKTINFKIYNKDTNIRLDTWAVGSNYGSDKLMVISAQAVRSYTNYAVNYIIKYGMEVQSK